MGRFLKYTRGQFTNEYYQLWEMGLLLPTPVSSSVYSVKYRKNKFDEYSRVTLKAAGVSDALERACYGVTYASVWRPEDIDLHAVYDEEENLLWIDEPFYSLVQQKNEFRGMERREFLFKFGMTSVAILFGLRPQRSVAATTSVSLGGTASGFVPTGEQMYTTPGSYSWTVPASVTSVSVVCIGGGGRAAVQSYYCSGGAGAGLGWKNNIAVTPGNSNSISVGAGSTSTASPGGTSSALSVQGVGGPSNTGSLTLSGGSYVGDGGGNGGGVPGGGGNNGYSGGGGAGGYSGAGGNGAYSSNTGGSGSGGAGGGGGLQAGNLGCGGGGGVGVYGVGSSGAGGVNLNGGSGGSGGSAGIAGSSSYGGPGGNGGAYGGGGGGTYGNGGGNPTGNGGSGAVRIIWGSGRSFPSNAA